MSRHHHHPSGGRSNRHRTPMGSAFGKDTWDPTRSFEEEILAVMNLPCAGATARAAPSSSRSGRKTRSRSCSARLVPVARDLLAATAPRGVQAVPRTDGSLFVVNTRPDSVEVRLSRPVTDRITGRTLAGATRMQAYEVLWIE